MNSSPRPQDILKNLAAIAGHTLLSLLPFILVFAGLLVVMVVLKRQSAKRLGGGLPLPYRCVASLLSNAERSFYGVLRGIAGPELVIFCKVRLADLLEIPGGTVNRQSHLNRVSAKHVDFLLCDSTGLHPLLVIELDDSSHNRADRQRRDAFLDDACHAASLPILHVPAQRAYTPTDIAAQIHTALGAGHPEAAT